MDNQLLKDYVATANSGKYQSNDEVYSKFPEFSDVDPQVLNDYVATANSGKYESVEKLNEKFPEFSTPVEKKEDGLDDLGNTNIDGFVQPREDQKDEKEPINPYTVGLDKNVKIAFDAKNSIKKENRKVVASAVESYFNLDEIPKKYENVYSPIEKSNIQRALEPTDEDIKAYFDEDKYEEYKAYKEQGVVPKSDGYLGGLEVAHREQQKMAMESVINDMEGEDERNEAILLLPDIIDDDETEYTINGKTEKISPQFLYNQMIKKSPEKAMRFQADYLTEINKNYKADVESFNDEKTAFELENADIYTEQAEIQEQFFHH